MKTTELYQQHKYLIKKLAYVISRQYNLEYDELICQGNYIFCKASRIYNKNHSSKASFYSFFKTMLYYELDKFSKKQIKESHTEIQDYFHCLKSNLDKNIIIQEAFQELSTEAKYIVNMTIEILPKSKGQIKKELQSKCWPIRKINHHFYEIKNKLKEIKNDSRTNQ